MFTPENKTVFILGAGASWHYGYPTGEQLIKEVVHYAKEHKKPYRMLSFLKETNLGNNSADKFITEFIELLEFLNPINIDNFLRLNPSYRNLGKRLISYVILENENTQNLNGVLADKDSNGNLRKNPIKLDWIRFFIHSLAAGCNHIDDLKDSLKNVEILTFNYDLSFEKHLIDKFSKIEIFRDIVNKNRNGTYELFNHLNIVHAYGSIYPVTELDKYDTKLVAKNLVEQGKISRRFFPDFNENVFIEDIIFDRLESLPNDNILVIGEEKMIKRKGHGDIDNIKQCIEEAKNLVFLGYGFDDDNNKLLLNIEDLLDLKKGSKLKTIYYTNFDKSEKINRKLEILKIKSADRPYQHKLIPSTKDCYGALAYDFDLS